MLDIIYLSCCTPTTHMQTCMSIVSLLSVLGERVSNFNIMVYTDSPEYFADYPVTCVMVSEELLTQWIGGGRYFFRIKPEALIYHAKSSPNPFVFLDSDTYFTGDPSDSFNQIRADHSLMCADETPILTARGKKNLRTFLKSFPDLWTPHFPDLLSQPPLMYNSGVIGMHPSMQDLLPTILDFIDACAKTKFPMHTFEQYAFTLYLDRRGSIGDLTHCLVHYWGYKPKMNLLIQNRFLPYIHRPLAEQIYLFGSLKEAFAACAHRTLLERVQAVPTRWWRSISKRWKKLTRLLAFSD